MEWESSIPLDSDIEDEYHLFSLLPSLFMFKGLEESQFEKTRFPLQSTQDGGSKK